MSEIDVKKLAELARIELTAEEEVNLANEIPAILDFVAQIQEATIAESADEPPFHLVVNRLRKDENPYEVGKFSEEIIRVAPNTKDGYFKVKKIIDHESE